MLKPLTTVRGIPSTYFPSFLNHLQFSKESHKMISRYAKITYICNRNHINCLPIMLKHLPPSQEYQYMYMISLYAKITQLQL